MGRVRYMRGGCLSVAYARPGPEISRERPAEVTARSSCLQATVAKSGRSWRSMGASSKFFKSLISGKRGGGGGVVVAPPAPTKALSDTTKATSTAGSEKAVSEKAPSERSHQSEKDDVVLVSMLSPSFPEFSLSDRSPSSFVPGEPSFNSHDFRDQSRVIIPINLYRGARPPRTADLGHRSVDLRPNVAFRTGVDSKIALHCCSLCQRRRSKGTSRARRGTSDGRCGGTAQTSTKRWSSRRLCRRARSCPAIVRSSRWSSCR